MLKLRLSYVASRLTKFMGIRLETVKVVLTQNKESHTPLLESNATGNPSTGAQK